MTTARGYLLLEVMIGGALCAVIIAGLMTQLSHVRKHTTYTSRDLTASQLLLEKLEERRHAAATVFPPTASPPSETITALDGRYTRTVSVNSTGCPESVVNPAGGPAMSLPCNNIVVTVTFDADDPSTVPIERRTATATTRVFQP